MLRQPAAMCPTRRMRGCCRGKAFGQTQRVITNPSARMLRPCAPNASILVGCAPTPCGPPAPSDRLLARPSGIFGKNDNATFTVGRDNLRVTRLFVDAALVVNGWNDWKTAASLFKIGIGFLG